MQWPLWREIAAPLHVKRRRTAVAIALGLATAALVGSAVAAVVEMLDDWF
jgi:ferric-dicitrate binding protein FerR (iron transport regulator)